MHFFHLVMDTDNVLVRDLARFELKIIAARLMQHVTFGDDGSEVNSSGHLVVFSIIPKYVGVTINFD